MYDIWEPGYKIERLFACVPTTDSLVVRKPPSKVVTVPKMDASCDSCCLRRVRESGWSELVIPPVPVAFALRI